MIMFGRRLSVVIGVAGLVLLGMSAWVDPPRGLEAAPQSFREVREGLEAAGSDVAAEPLPAQRLHTYSNLAAPLPPRDAELHRQWKAAEPGFEHVVLRDEQCDRALEKFFPKVPRGASSMSFALRSVVCGLVAVWHDGGYYIHRDVTPNSSTPRPISSVFPQGRGMAIMEDVGVPILWFFGAARQHPCAANALNEIGGLLQSQRLDGLAFGTPRCDQPWPVQPPAGFLRDLLGEGTCRGAHGPHPAAADVVPRRFDVADNPCTPLSAALTFVGSEAAHADTEAVWEREEGEGAAVHRHDAAMCASLVEALAGRSIDGVSADAVGFVCGLLAVKERGGIALGHGMRWLRPTRHWLPATEGTIVGRLPTGQLVPGFAAAQLPSSCLEGTMQRLGDGLRDGAFSDLDSIAKQLPRCVTTIDFDVAGGSVAFDG